MERLPQGYLSELNLMTGEERILAETDAYEPDWSPDGSRILFSDVETVFMVPATGGLPRRLINERFSADLFDPAWSPDGRRVAMVYGSDIRISDLYVLDLTVYQDEELLAEGPSPIASPDR